jgi:hypothetical protein
MSGPALDYSYRYSFASELVADSKGTDCAWPRAAARGQQVTRRARSGTAERTKRMCGR